MISAKLANTILLRVLSKGLGGKGVMPVKMDGCFLVIPGNNAPRWIVPVNPQLGGNVLAHWRPYGLASRLKWYALCTLYTLRVISRIPGIRVLVSVVDNYLRIPGQSVDVVPVIYVGTPGPQQKAVVTLVDSNNGKALAVMKVALEEAACASLLREAKTLQLLSSLGVNNVPQLLASDEAIGRTWQTVVHGRLASKKLTALHVDWLLELPVSGKTATFEDQKKRLCKLVGDECAALPAQELGIITRAIEHIKSQTQIPLVLVHGDFAPWNIKKQSNGELAVIDWEDAEFDGLPLWDLCHFYFIQAHLFKKRNVVKIFLASSHVARYLKGIGIEKADMSALVLLYILFMAISKDRNTSPGYSAFLIDQIPLVLVN